MLDDKSQVPSQASPNCCTWNARGLCEFPHWCERGLIKGLENCFVDNIGREVWMLLFVLSNLVRRVQMGHHRRASDCIGTEDLHKFIMDRLGWKSLRVEIATNCALVYCAVREALTSNSIFAQRNDVYSITRVNTTISLKWNMFL
jgi:hypothetical protein